MSPHSVMQPLWSLCSMNDEALRESTPADKVFDYVDIGDVTTGRISEDVESYSFGEAPSRARRLANPGDVIVSTVRTYLRAIAQVTEMEADRVFSTGFAVLRPIDGVTEPRFLAYALSSEQVMDEIVATSVGVGYPAIAGTALHRIKVPSHNLQTRRAIADYLDHETAGIDVMLGKLDQLADALRVRRRAVIQSALGSLFNGELVPLWKILFPVKDQNHPGEEILSVYRDHGVIPKSSRDDNFNRTPSDLSAYQLVRPTDVVINKMKAWQGSLGVSPHRGIVSPDYQVARIRAEVEPNFLHLILRSPLMIPQYRARSIGVRPAQWRLYWDDFADLRIPLPSAEVQRRITEELHEVTSKIDTMQIKLAELQALLTERRQALITEVVTGRKDVA